MVVLKRDRVCLLANRFSLLNTLTPNWVSSTNRFVPCKPLYVAIVIASERTTRRGYDEYMAGAVVESPAVFDPSIDVDSVRLAEI